MSAEYATATKEEMEYMHGYADLLAAEAWLANEVTSPDYDGRLDKHISESVNSIVNAKEKGEK